MREAGGVLQRHGVDTRHAIVRHGDHPFAVILIAEDSGERVVLWRREASLSLSPADLDEFVKCYNPANRNQRKPTWDEKKQPDGRWRAFTHDEIVARDKCSLDIFWLKGPFELDRPINSLYKAMGVGPTVH